MIDTSLYVHKDEKRAFDEMINNTFFSDEIMDYYENYDQKLRKPDLLGKTVTVTQNQFKSIYDIVTKVSGQLDLKVPPVYVYEDFYYGVEAKGADDPWIEVSAKTIVDFSEPEMLFMISRELCAIKLRHTYYQTLIDESFTAFSENVPLPGSEMFIKTLRVSMFRWSRIANYTEDCFGYLMCKDLKPCISALLKLVLNNSYLADNVNISEYLKQADAINAMKGTVHQYAKMDERVPYGPFRMKYLIAYISSSRGMAAIKYNR